MCKGKSDPVYSHQNYWSQTVETKNKTRRSCFLSYHQWSFYLDSMVSFPHNSRFSCGDQ